MKTLQEFILEKEDEFSDLLDSDPSFNYRENEFLDWLEDQYVEDIDEKVEKIIDQELDELAGSIAEEYCKRFDRNGLIRDVIDEIKEYNLKVTKENILMALHEFMYN